MKKRIWLMRSIILLLLSFPLILILCSKDYVINRESLQSTTMCTFNTPGSALIFTAMRKGFFKSAGIDLNLTVWPTGKECIQSMEEGGFDYAAAYITPIARAIARQQSFSILTELHRSERGTVIAYRKNGSIKNPSDLAGKRVGLVNGTNGEFILSLYLRTHSIPGHSCKIVDVSPDELMTNLEDNIVDAVVLWEPYISKLKKTYPNEFIFVDSPLYPEISVLVGDRTIVERKPEIATGLIIGLKKAKEFSESNPEEFKQIILDYMDIESPSFEKLNRDYSFNLGLTSVLRAMLAAELSTQMLASQDQRRLERKVNLYLAPKFLLKNLPQTVTLR